MIENSICTEDYLRYCLYKTQHTRDYLINTLSMNPNTKGYEYSGDSDTWYTYNVNEEGEVIIHKKDSENECIKELLTILEEDLKSDHTRKWSELPSYVTYINDQGA